MEIVFCKTFGWDDALDAARTTGNMSIKQKENPSEEFKRRVLVAEHSPIREVRYKVRADSVPKWVTTHLVRHKYDPFVGTQRVDRTGSTIPRNEHPQGEPTAIFIDANGQSLIDVSRKRLCGTASVETRKLWRLILKEIAKKDPIIVDYCVPNCIYRGFCPEEKCCGLVNSPKFKEMREKYVKMCIESARPNKK